MLVAFSLPVKFSKSVFFGVKFQYYKNNSVDRWNHSKSEFSTVDWAADSEEIRQCTPQ